MKTITVLELQKLRLKDIDVEYVAQSLINNTVYFIFLFQFLISISFSKSNHFGLIQMKSVTKVQNIYSR